MKHNDIKTTVAQLKEKMKDFVQERDWHKFHTPKNVAINISVEASELLEKFIWLDAQESWRELENNRDEIEDELADIFMSVLSFANAADIDLSQAVSRKLQEACKKYPVEKAKGVSTKYTKL